MESSSAAPEGGSDAVRPEDLDLGSLALFVGLTAAEEVRRDIEREGFTGLRFSHGYVFQHLVDAEPTIGELATRLEMTQQGASKAVAELERLGYVERVPDPADARIRRARLNARGRAAVEAARRGRAAQQERMARRCGRERLDTAHAVLVELLDALGGADGVRRRDVRFPS
ncbi:MarR family winged helix-turn-helix transcriptional regulator [Actinomadura sp. K4S16]|uniref:MarR family winged helix-turn-helix transcriptional regulator n=1 Tax=Actinomadura sp. K4S16 TaxID=1316147 RepID=UPI00190F82E3|nr:helix-turn-helix domain-containing protein [Actinomadura sp. K4S16]